MKLHATDVFTPNDFPEHTYVRREGEDLEQRLERALATPKVVVSISGPSKSGKTVLVEQQVGKDNLITISGAEVRSGEDLWSRVLGWMDVPASTAEQITTTTGQRVGAEASGKAGVPIIAEASGKASYDHARGKSKTSTKTHSIDGLRRVVKEIGDSEFVLLLDDFHYIPKDRQTDVARQIKAAAERGVQICVATVPHRADDVVRSNHELRGRLAQVDTSFWTVDELAQIALLGFPKLLVDVTPQQAARLAAEACGSPQLMQRICLDVCFDFGVRHERKEKSPIDLEHSRLQAILEQSSTHSDFGTMVGNMHQGPRTRGTERRVHKLIDGSEGDVYRVLLLALAQGNPTMSLPYATLMERVSAVCDGDTPSASSIVQACRQLDTIAKRIAPSERVLEWDDQELTGTMSVVNPYFLFYLRCSRKLQKLASEKSDTTLALSFGRAEPRPRG
jgi:hypothetical protein